MFLAGQQVRRVGPSVLGVEKGSVYTVSSHDDGALRLEGLSGKYFAKEFELLWLDNVRVGYATPRDKSTEVDPNGRSPHEPGAKVDSGKAEYDIVLGYFPAALAAVNEVAAYGAKKYTLGGWRTVPDGIKRYGNAGIRHHVARLSGEERDKDTKLLHAAHAAWNALATLELILKDSA